MTGEILFHQTIASTVSHVVEQNLQNIQEKISKQEHLEKASISIQDERFMDALSEVSKVRTFLSDPTRILGANGQNMEKSQRK